MDFEAKLNFIKTNIENIEDFKFQSQYDQDFLAYIFFNGKKNGFYIDIGAYDGIALSNTFIFEKLGWKGFCVEASPKNFSELQKNRKCDLYNYAICNKNIGKAKFLTSNISVLDVLDIHNTVEHKERIKRESDNMEYVEVNTITFDDLMKNYPNINNIDFLSLDIEGGELDVLKTIDFQKYNFNLLTIENNEPKDTLIDFMKEKGYKALLTLGCDILFIKNSI